MDCLGNLQQKTTTNPLNHNLNITITPPQVATTQTTTNKNDATEFITDSKGDIKIYNILMGEK